MHDSTNCKIDTHDHTGGIEAAANCGLPVPEDDELRCLDCGRVCFYDYATDDYHHGDDPETGCFLIPSEAPRTHLFRVEVIVPSTVADLPEGFSSTKDLKNGIRGPKDYHDGWHFNSFGLASEFAHKAITWRGVVVVDIFQLEPTTSDRPFGRHLASVHIDREIFV
jgi:hypothetical protein